MTYPVNEVFLSVQGEGHYAGRRAIFVRLQGYPVGCQWCDTKHTWHVEQDHLVSERFMVAKGDAPMPTWAALTTDELADAVRALVPSPGPFRLMRLPLVVLTGGEPALHDLQPLVAQLSGRDYPVQVETSGTLPLGRLPRGVWVTCSPKYGMPGGLPVLPEVLDRADELKLVLTCERDEARALDLLDRYGAQKPIYLQPVSQNPRLTARAVALVEQFGFRLSLQTHKYAGAR